MPRGSWARVPQLLRPRSRACGPQLPRPGTTTTEALAPTACSPQQEKSLQEACAPQLTSGPSSTQREKAMHSNRGPVQTKINK